MTGAHRLSCPLDVQVPLLLSITKVRDAQIAYIVIPAQAGIQCLLTNAAGSPLKPALECLNRGRDDASFVESVIQFGSLLGPARDLSTEPQSKKTSC